MLSKKLFISLFLFAFLGLFITQPLPTASAHQSQIEVSSLAEKAGGSLIYSCEYIGGYSYYHDPKPRDVLPSNNPENKFWGEQFSPSGVSDHVNAIVKDSQGMIYMGGFFTAAGHNKAYFLVRWDGQQWLPFAEELNGRVYDMAIDSEDNLYITGRFTSIGDLQANRVAKWDGSQWHALDSGIDHYGYAIAIDSQDNVYVGGRFMTAGGTPANHIAQWNGENWSAVGSTGVGENDSEYLTELFIDNQNNIYAGGYFDDASGVTAHAIAKWNGTIWQPLGSGFTHGGDGTKVYALAMDNQGILYAGGEFYAGNNTYNIAKWNGTSWEQMGAGTNRPVRVLAFDAEGNLFAGGQFTEIDGVEASLIARWDGTTWHPLDTGIDADAYCAVHTLLNDNGTLYVGGNFTRVGDKAISHIATWDNQEWHTLTEGLGVQGIIQATVIDNHGRLYVAGTISTAGGQQVHNIAMWDGQNWHDLGGGTNNVVHALALDNQGNLYVGGEFTSAGGIPASRVAKWNGETWQALGAGVNNTVKSLATNSAGHLYIGGRLGYILKWDGISYSQVGGSIGNNTVHALIVDNQDNLYAGGEFIQIGEQPHFFIAKWDGLQWISLGDGLYSTVYSLALDQNGHLYAGGSFDGGVAKWNGQTWSYFVTLDQSYRAVVYALAVDSQNHVYIGGRFNWANDEPAYYLIKWNGTTWKSVGSGMNGEVYALAVDNHNNLYAGGEFTLAGGKSASRLALWRNLDWQFNQTISSVHPNPGETITYTLEIKNNGSYTITNGLLEDNFPAALTNITYTVSGLELTQQPDTTYSWAVGNIAPGTTGVITVTGVLTTGTITQTVVTNTAVFTATDIEACTSTTFYVNNGQPFYQVFLPIIYQSHNNSLPNQCD